MILIHKTVKSILLILSFGAAVSQGIALAQNLWSTATSNGTTEWFLATIFSGIFLLSGLSTVYHIRTFPILPSKYSKSPKRKISRLLWIGAYGFGISLILFCIWGLTEENKNPTVEAPITFILYGLICLALIMIAETQATYLHYNKNNRPKESDLDEIGNS